ncbi:MAG: phosphodiester glycosidase family protein [Flavimaricola sp.]|nr:phosphodiester glycosidase family protein [Flavimaricola sp.]
MRRAGASLLVLWLGLSGTTAGAVVCEDVTFEGQSWTTCTVTPATEDLRLFHSDSTGGLYGSFSAIDGDQPDGRRLGFAMNAGMYHSDRRPVGLYVEDGEQTMRLITNPGPGNFGLLPNGVLCLTDTRARVIETLRFEAEKPEWRDATQSGPMLVIDGALHPRFLPRSTSRYVRNGVGTTEAGDLALFAISNGPVTFHEFGRFFRDHLGLPQALYFDGNVSRLYAPGLGRSDAGFALGPIVGVLE